SQRAGCAGMGIALNTGIAITQSVSHFGPGLRRLRRHEAVRTTGRRPVADSLEDAHALLYRTPHPAVLCLNDRRFAAACARRPQRRHDRLDDSAADEQPGAAQYTAPVRIIADAIDHRDPLIVRQALRIHSDRVNVTGASPAARFD